MTREELIAALEHIVTQGWHDRRTVELYAIGLILGFMSNEGYGDLAQAWLRLREQLR